MSFFVLLMSEAIFPFNSDSSIKTLRSFAASIWLISMIKSNWMSDGCVIFWVTVSLLVPKKFFSVKFAAPLICFSAWPPPHSHFQTWGGHNKPAVTNPNGSQSGMTKTPKILGTRSLVELESGYSTRLQRRQMRRTRSVYKWTILKFYGPRLLGTAGNW